MSEDMRAERPDPTQDLLKEQLSIMRKQLRLSRILAAMAALATAVLLAAALVLVPPAYQSLKKADRLLEGLDASGLTEVVDDLSALTESSQKGIERTVDKLDQLDVEGLNRAIQNLESATRPLAGLFGN